MNIVNTAVAGTLESSDVMVTVEPADEGITVQLSSNVLNQYGRQIKKVVLETLELLNVTAANVIVVDKGALDCTIRARVECAAHRAACYEGKVQWGQVIPG